MEKTQMTLEEFTTEYETLMDNDEEKAAVILAETEPDLYLRYWVEVCGEELEEDDEADEPLTYEQFVTQFEELGNGGFQAAANCLALDYPEYYDKYTEDFFPAGWNEID